MANTNSINFTDAKVKSLKPQAKRYEIGDAGSKGLRVRVSPGGSKTFFLKFRHGDKIKMVTLGQYGEHEGQLTLAKARKLMVTQKEKIQNGILPDQQEVRTVADLAELFFQKRIIPHRKRPDIIRQVLDHDLLPIIGKKRIKQVSAPMLSGLVDTMVDRGATTHAGKLVDTLKQMFKFAEGRGIVDRSPAYALDKKGLGIIQVTRKRALDIDAEGNPAPGLPEIKKLWHVLDTTPKLSPQIRAGVKILLLTGVRWGELNLATWENVDLDKKTWFIPAQDTKTDRAWTVPLSLQVVDLLTKLKALDIGPWVLSSPAPKTTNEDGEEDEPVPLSDKALGRAVRRIQARTDDEGNKVLDIEYFRPHDLRRTLRSHLSGLGIAPHVSEKCLNHSLGKIGETYDRATFLDERREALDKWADHIDLALNGSTNVTILGAANA